jgi:tetratricopeptide (TPR) repeat protein
MTTVSKDDENVSFLIELAAPAEKLEHFWWEEKNRLIVDIYGDISKGERDQTEVSQPVAKNQEKKVSDSQGNQASAEPEKVDLPTATSALEDEARNTQSGSSIGQAVSSDDKDTEAKKTISVSPGLATLSGSQGGSSDSTPEAVLETLIPSLAPEAADLLRRILKATGENKADRAIELIAKYDEQYQGRAIEPLMLLRGDLYFLLGLQGVPGSFDEAVNAYRDSNALSGRSTLQPWVLLQLGRIQLRRKRYLEALGYLDLVINKHRSSPHKATALIHRGRLYLEKDRADLALDDFQQVLSECPESPHIDEALLGKAISLSLRGEHNQAEALFAEIEIRTPKFYLRHPEILYYWGRNDLILERFQRGREKFFLALNVGLQPQDTDLLLAHIGDSFRSQGEPDRAASYYRLSMKLFPGSDGAMVSRARLAEQSGDMELMAEIVREHPESEMAEFALLRMAAYFHEKGNDHEAIRRLEQLERGYPASSLKKESRRLLRRSLRKRVEQLRRQGDYWELLALLKTVKLWLAGMYRLKAGLWEAEAYVKLSLWDDAVAALTAIAPDDLDKEDRLQWTLLLGQAYESKGDLVLAESLLRGLASTVSGGKSAGEVKWKLARILQKAGNHEDGVAAYRELLNGELAGAARPKALMAMAKSLLALGQDREARDACQRVLSLLSEGDQEVDLRAAAWADLGEIHYREGSFELAARAYEKALQYGENSAPAPAIHQRSRLASCYHKLGAPAKAQHLYQKIEREAGDLWRQMVSVSQRIQELQSKINEVEPPES